MKIIITAKALNGEKVIRVVFSEFQAFTVINALHKEGCENFGMRSEPKSYNQHEHRYNAL